MFTLRKNVSGLEWNKLMDRLDVLEDKVFKKKKRIQATVPQKILILKHLGLLEKIEQLDIQRNKKALLISVLTDSDLDNSEKEMNKANYSDSDSRSERNYSFLVSLFQDLNLEKHTQECEKILTQVISTKEE